MSRRPQASDCRAWFKLGGPTDRSHRRPARSALAVTASGVRRQSTAAESPASAARAPFRALCPRYRPRARVAPDDDGDPRGRACPVDQVSPTPLVPASALHACLRISRSTPARRLRAPSRRRRGPAGLDRRTAPPRTLPGSPSLAASGRRRPGLRVLSRLELVRPRDPDSSRSSRNPAERPVGEDERLRIEPRGAGRRREDRRGNEGDDPRKSPSPVGP